MAGRMVAYAANGAEAQGYLASPLSGRGPGAIVIQEWWGLNDQIKGVADRLAAEGFNALAPDFYHGKSARIGEPDEAQKLMMEFFQANTAAKDARGAAQFLVKHGSTSSRKAGVIGFCMGGLLALITGTVAPDEVGAVVDCYGVPPQQKPDYAKLKGAAILGIFAGRDGFMPAEKVAELEGDLRRAGVKFEKKVYPEADHAFMNEQRRDVYRPDDARDAWARAVRFLKGNVS